MPVARTQPKVNAENRLASATGSEHKVGWLHVSVDEVPLRFQRREGVG